MRWLVRFGQIKPFVRNTIGWRNWIAVMYAASQATLGSPSGNGSSDSARRASATTPLASLGKSSTSIITRARGEEGERFEGGH